MNTKLVTRARVRAALVLYLVRAASAVLLAYPVARTIAAFLPPAFPSADVLFFTPGAYYAAEALRLGGRAIQGSLEGSAMGFVLVAIGTCFPFAIALSALVYPAESLPSLAKRATACTAPIVAIGGATALAQAVVIAAIAGALGAASGSLDPVLDERQGDLTLLGLALIAGSSLLVMGLAADLARAAAVRHGARAFGAVALAVGALRRAPGAIAAAWLPACVATVAVVAGAAFATSAIDVSRPGTARVWAVALLHQSAVLASVVLRLYWLERALAIVGPEPLRGSGAGAVSETPQLSLAGTPARNAAPDDPTPDPAA
jgi:hypothetical protein